MDKIEHIGIAVKDLSLSNNIYAQLLGTGPYKSESVESEKVITSFFQVGENKIELLQSSDASGVIGRFIENKGEGIHHVAFAVGDIRKEMKRLKDSGFILLNDEPKQGADNKLVCFVHPKNTSGVLIESCEELK